MSDISTANLSPGIRRELDRRALARAGGVPAAGGMKLGVPSYGSVGAAFLEDVPKAEDCDCGLSPAEYNIVIVTADVREMVGNVIVSDETKDRLKDAMQLARIVEASPVAFNYDKFPPGTKPKVGDLIWFAKFAGGAFTGIDGRDYRIIKDKDVMAVIKPRAAKEESKVA